MKKLFYAFLFAAASLMVSCGTPNEGNEPDPQPQEKPFYGFEMEGADVTVIGGDQYIFQMYSYNTEQTMIERLLSAHVTIPGVDLEAEQFVLPEGTYELLNGSIGDTGAYIKGSYYQNDVAETPYTALFTSATMEVKHTAKGHRITVWAEGINAADGSVIKDIEFRYENELKAYGNVIPMVATVDEEGNPEYPYAIFMGQYTEEANLWVIEAAVEETFTYYYDFYILTPIASGYEQGIPTGKYPFSYTGEANTAIPTLTNSQGQFTSGGSLFFVEDEQGLRVNDVIWGGEIDIVNNGDGTYEVTALYYNYYNIPQVAYYEGALQYINNAKEDIVEIQYNGDILWTVFLCDGEAGICNMLEVYSAEGTTFEGGLTAGTYNVTSDCEPMTIFAGMIADGYYDGGSALCSYDLKTLYDIVTDGTMEVAKNADGTYKFNVSFEYSMNNPYTWTYEGAVEAYDLTAEENAAAPLKAAIKSQNKGHKVENNATYELRVDRNVRF